MLVPVCVLLVGGRFMRRFLSVVFLLVVTQAPAQTQTAPQAAPLTAADVNKARPAAAEIAEIGKLGYSELEKLMRENSDTEATVETLKCEIVYNFNPNPEKTIIVRIDTSFVVEGQLEVTASEIVYHPQTRGKNIKLIMIDELDAKITSTHSMKIKNNDPRSFWLTKIAFETAAKRLGQTKDCQTLAR